MRCFVLSTIMLFIPLLLQGKEMEDSVLAETPSSKNPFFLAAKAQSGFVFQTNDFVINEGIDGFSSFDLKFCNASKGDDWRDYAYGMPYFGVGIGAATFHDHRLGTPISFYLIQGARIFSVSVLSFNYEFNLGYSTNWRYYDRFNNPDNIAVSTSENIHVGASLYLKVKSIPRVDMNIGVSLTHFSNGAQRLPNKGMNLMSPYIEICYNINPPESHSKPELHLLPPKIKKRIDHDLLLTFSSRQISYSTEGTGLTTGFVDHKFRVIGLSYASMFVRKHSLKWGPSIEIVYDESGGATAKREIWKVDGQYYDRVALGNVKQRLNVGLSVKGELVMPYFSLFTNIGYDLYHGNPNDSRFYQILGTKFHFYRNFFGTFGIRANHFSKAQFIFWSAGYTI